MVSLLRAITTTIFGLGGCGGIVIESFRTFAHDSAADESLQHAQFTVVFRRDETDGIAHDMGASGAAEAEQNCNNLQLLTTVHMTRLEHGNLDLAPFTIKGKEMQPLQETAKSVVWDNQGGVGVVILLTLQNPNGFAVSFEANHVRVY